MPQTNAVVGLNFAIRKPTKPNRTSAAMDQPSRQRRSSERRRAVAISLCCELATCHRRRWPDHREACSRIRGAFSLQQLPVPGDEDHPQRTTDVRNAAVTPRMLGILTSRKSITSVM